jgi:hypothetical protein
MAHLGISHGEQINKSNFHLVINGRGIIKSFSRTFLGQLFSLFRDNCDVLETAFKTVMRSEQD